MKDSSWRAGVKQLTLSRVDEPQLYVAKAQNGGIFTSVAARTAGDPDAMAEAVREAIWAVDRDQPVWKIRSMASLLDHDLAPRRFTARLTAGFAVLALLLALIGAARCPDGSMVAGSASPPPPGVPEPEVDEHTDLGVPVLHARRIAESERCHQSKAAACSVLIPAARPGP